MTISILPEQSTYIAHLEARIAELEHHAAFDLPRRPVLERRWAMVNPCETRLIFFDLDGMNALNARFGYAEVDRRIRATFDTLRSETRADTSVFLYQGGDEFVALCPASNAHGLTARIQLLLWSNGLSASFAIVPMGDDLQATVEVATARLKVAGRGARGKGRRGITVLEDGTVIGPDAPRSRWAAFWMR